MTWFISKEKNNDTLDILSGDHIREERWVAWKNPSKNWYILYKHITGHKSTTYRPQQPHTDRTPTTYCTYPIPTAYCLDQLVHYYSIDCPRISHYNYTVWLDQWCYDWFILYIFCFLGYRHCHTGVRSFLLFHQGVSAVVVQSSEIMINRIIIINTVVIFVIIFMIIPISLSLLFYSPSPNSQFCFVGTLCCSYRFDGLLHFSTAMAIMQKALVQS